MNEQQAKEEQVAQAAKAVADELGADVILYNGALHRAGATLLINQTAALQRRPNVLLLLVTPGGDADAAYQIARWLQRKYERFVLFVSGYCKSAGTLIAVGAHELVMSKSGELGPLDVQMPKRDEPTESLSGLDVPAALMALQAHALDTFVSALLKIQVASEGTLSLQMSMEIATAMTTELFAPIYGQIDPIHIGETTRAMNIASQYGERLLSVGKNTGIEQLDYIVSGYTSHRFVIDREEASDLFRSVRNPTENESVLADLLGTNALYPIDQDDMAFPLVRVLSQEPSDVTTKNDACSTKGGNNAPATHDAQRAIQENGPDAD